MKLNLVAILIGLSLSNVLIARHISAHGHHIPTQQNHTDSPKYVIGAMPTEGLFSCFFCVLHHLFRCEKNKKIPVVYWDKNSLYYIDEGFNGNNNVWEYYFEPISHLAYEAGDLVHNTYTFRRSESYDFHFSSIEQKIRESAYQLISKYIKLKPYVQNKIDTFYEQHMIGKKTIGIHFRGTDQVSKQRDYPLVEQAIEKALAFADKDTQFLIATDEQALLDSIIRLLHGYKVIYYDCYRSKDRKPLHYQGSVRPRISRQLLHYNEEPTDSKKSISPRPPVAQNGEDVLVEASLLAKCDLLVHTRSSVSTAALYFNPSLQNILLN